MQSSAHFIRYLLMARLVDLSLIYILILPLESPLTVGQGTVWAQQCGI